ncbi:MAG: CDP-alcohol phosphatidyltransferase family protein [Fibrobacteres bacterium]|nr:CDP-alcohol phosphatidyltransferase family protein [Fibrobacterota bacterium]
MRDLSKYKIVLPGAITSLSILCGLFAVIFAFNEDLIAHHGGWLVVSSWLVILAAMIDGIDGKIARMTNSSSEFGIQYDSIADVVTFGMASTIVIYRQIIMDAVVNNPAYYIIPIIILLCGAIRLARFNTTASTSGKKCFYGLPIPAAAGTMMALFLFLSALETGFDIDGFPSIVLSTAAKLRITVIFALVVSILMVSTVKFSITHSFLFADIPKNKIRFGITLLIFLVLFINAGTAFFLISVFYIIYHILAALFKKNEVE